ncbi:hypothetical protein NGB36_30285 [Streptomyces sp. RB6PN25]|uniref:Condensation domain-containing protein n=1 Tax=Streptomyces humicola TaxID=2953240 RepID=A0ABT1Q4A0_9ACTN|nr:hypothetical protein [Streptomyces humicola]MCQ4084746.1 hypothetical protein [Streptomyces humicola]
MTVPGRRLPFTAVDECADLLERRGEPNVILLELAVAGRLDAGRLRAAVDSAFQAHPMARARRAAAGRWRFRSSWEIPERTDADPLTVAAPGAAPGDERRRTMDTPLPLGTSPLLRLRLLPGTGDGGDRLLVGAHHALFDAVSCLGFVTSVVRRYNGEPDPEPPLDPAVARAGTQPDPSHPAPTPAPSHDGGRPVRIARTAPRHTRGYGCVLFCLDPGATTALAAGSRRRGVTVNDALIAATAITVARWNRAHGHPSAPVRITMPINTRDAAHRFEVISNLSRLTSVTATTDEPRALLASVAAQTTLAKRSSAPAGGPAAVLLGAPYLPYAVRRSFVPTVRLAARMFADTTMVSNLGRIPDPPPFDGAGPVTALWMAAPAPMPRGLSVSALTVAGRLHLAVRFRRAALDEAAAGAFTDLLGHALEDVALLPTAHERLPR